MMGTLEYAAIMWILRDMSVNYISVWQTGAHCKYWIDCDRVEEIPVMTGLNEALASSMKNGYAYWRHFR